MAVPRLAWALLSIGLACAVTVTPVQKVTDLLERLAKVVEQEGKDEATAYDKYACFCKSESDDKQYAIENSQELEAKLGAKISKLGGEIQDLDGEIQTLGQDILRLTGDIDTENSARQSTHATFLTNQADATSAISAVERAIEALKSSKDALAGKVELEASSLAQVRSAASLALATSVGAALPVEALVQLRSLQGQPGVAYSYKYHSNEIIGTLETVLDTFKKRLARLEKEEFDSKTASELKVQGLSNERKFAKKEKAEKTEVREAKQEEKSQAEADKTAEEIDRTADTNFLGVLQADCEQKAQYWDQRSRTRADELTAIGNAVDALKSGVAPNWKANKKLVGLQTQAAPKGHWEFVADAPSFLQIRGSSLRGATAAQGAAVVKAQHFLAEAASNLKSQVLSVAALKVLSMGDRTDHFVRVRQIINDLMDKLEADATAEQTHKQFCDTEIADAISRRDTEQGKVETQKATIAGKEAEKAQLKREIAELSKQIAQNVKALAEKTELRNEESAENNRTVTDAGDGKLAVENAIAFLKNFYEPLALTQYTPWKATNSDREGKTVADKAPEVFDSEYKGSQEASKGIIGILEVILSDFDRTVDTVSAAETAAEGTFQTFKTTNEADTQTKETSVTTKEGQVSTLDADLVTANTDLDNAEANHKTALSELDNLHAQCIQGEETYEERVANRNREIEALKEAHNILENWS